MGTHQPTTINPVITTRSFHHPQSDFQTADLPTHNQDNTPTPPCKAETSNNSSAGVADTTTTFEAVLQRVQKNDSDCGRSIGIVYPTTPNNIQTNPTPTTQIAILLPPPHLPQTTLEPTPTSRPAPRTMLPPYVNRPSPPPTVQQQTKSTCKEEKKSGV
jgi:hypothetical protein